MKKHHLYCTVVLLVLPWQAGCSCTFQAGSSTGTSSAKVANHRPARRDKPKANKKDKNEKEKVATKSTSATPRATITKEDPRPATSATPQETNAATDQATLDQNATSPKQRLTPKVYKPTDNAASAARSPSGETQSADQTPGNKREALTPKVYKPADDAPSAAKSQSGTQSESSSGMNIAERARKIKDAMATNAVANRNRDLAKKASTTEPQSSPSGQETTSTTGQTSRGSILMKAPSEKSMSCSLSAAQAPRGGKVDIKAQGFGSTPVVRIAGKVLRIIQREASLISAQVPEDSNGGAVTLTAYGVTAECGRLEIIGKNR